MITIKKHCTVILCMSGLLFSAASIAKDNNAAMDATQGAQWFIQDGAYSSLKNAMRRVEVLIPLYEEKMSGYIEPDDLPNSHVRVHEQDGMYKVIIGPYVDAKVARQHILPAPFGQQGSMVISLQKPTVDHLNSGYRFTLRRITADEYEQVRIKNMAALEGISDAVSGQFVKASIDKHLRFVALSESYFIERRNDNGQWVQYPLNHLFEEHEIKRIDLDNLAWTSDNRLMFFDTTLTGYRTCNAVYEISLFENEVGDEEPELKKADCMALHNLKRRQTLEQENITIIEDFAQARQMLKGQVTFYAYNIRDEQEKDKELDISSYRFGRMKCSNGNDNDLHWDFGFMGYFPQE